MPWLNPPGFVVMYLFITELLDCCLIRLRESGAWQARMRICCGNFWDGCAKKWRSRCGCCDVILELTAHVQNLCVGSTWELSLQEGSWRRHEAPPGYHLHSHELSVWFWPFSNEQTPSPCSSEEQKTHHVVCSVQNQRCWGQNGGELIRTAPDVFFAESVNGTRYQIHHGSSVDCSLRTITWPSTGGGNNSQSESCLQSMKSAILVV